MPTSLCPNLLAFWGLTTTAWIIMWSGLLSVSILLVLLIRTRWSTKRTWQKCAILSLWVHVLLAVLSTTVRVVTGAPESGPDTPILVAVVDLSEVTEEIPDEPAEKEPAEPLPDWEMPEAPPLVAPRAKPLLEPETSADQEEPLDASAVEQLVNQSTPSPLPLPASSLEAPPLMPSAQPTETAAATAPAQSDAPQEPAEESALVEAEPPVRESVAKTPAQQPPQQQPAPAKGQAELADVFPPKTPAPRAPTMPAKYTDRFIQDKDQLVSQRGGSAQTEQAVRAALGWLAAAQSSTGGWDASRFGAGQERVVLGHNRQGAGGEADTGITGLATLAFLGAGHSHMHGEYRTEVARALEYLRQRQRADGSLQGKAALFARTYCHSMATLAVCEAYAMSQDKRLEPVARRAVAYSLSLQHPSDGGWRYRRGDTGDTSQLGWQVMSLKSAELAGIEIPGVVWTRVEHFLRRVQRGNAGGLAAYRPDSPASRTMTAEAWFCKQLLHENPITAMPGEAVQEATDYLMQEPPSLSLRNLYYWYYATLALQQNQAFSHEAKSAWDDWNHALTTALISSQADDGSWDKATLWGGYGGRVYTTAVSTLCLEVYYRYKPPQSPPAVADRDKWQSMR